MLWGPAVHVRNIIKEYHNGEQKMRLLRLFTSSFIGWPLAAHVLVWTICPLSLACAGASLLPLIFYHAIASFLCCLLPQFSLADLRHHKSIRLHRAQVRDVKFSSNAGGAGYILTTSFDKTLKVDGGWQQQTAVADCCVGSSGQQQATAVCSGQ